MTLPIFYRTATSTGRKPFTKAVLAVAAAGIVLAGCKAGQEETRVAGWSLVDPTQRHPIIVTQKPTTISLRVARGSSGLSPHQRAQIISFLERYRGAAVNDSRLVIEAPSGSPNEIASMQAVAEIRALMAQAGFDASSVNLEGVQAGGDPQAPIRVSFLRYVAEGPQCGHWPTDMGSTSGNAVYPNLGCSTQANLAAMVANPSDLVRPRSSTPRSGERDGTVWEKYVKGESTVSQKSGDERVQVKGSN